MRAVLSLAVSLVISLAIPVAVPALAQDVMYEYDRAGRLVEVGYSNDVVITYEYDPAGNRTEQSTDSSTGGGSGGAGAGETIIVMPMGGILIMVVEN